MSGTAVHELPTASEIKDARPPGPSFTLLVGQNHGRDLRARSFAFSFVAHVFAVVLIAISSGFVLQHRRQLHRQFSTVVTEIVPVSPYVLPPARITVGGGGGGGDADKLAASKGALPKFSREQITPPTVVIRNLNPKLSAEPSVVVPPEIRLPVQSGAFGDPLSNILGPPSSGVGTGGGIGSGTGGGVGSGYGPGVGPGRGGGIGGGLYHVGGGVSAPRLIYGPDPEYSEEARKAKYQGTVVLWLIVGPDGHPRDIRLARSLGMGLDEKALETVRTWKFEPARKNGTAVAVQVSVEVTFRLF